jgi:SAM-dependent methyltransferase
MVPAEAGDVPAAERWALELAAWRIDDAILAAAPESPYGYPPALFRAPATGGPGSERGTRGQQRSGIPGTPSRQRAAEALPPGGSVLDVGCGGGAAGLALVPSAGELTGVDKSPAMLASFRDAAAARGLAPDSVHTVEGAWPDIADLAPVADVVVCHHVAYNVPDLAAFARALTVHARRRVVVELTAVHPWVPLGPLWRRVHGQTRPDGPSAHLAVEVLAEEGIEARVAEWERPDRWATAMAAEPDDEGARRIEAETVAFTRRRLCLPADRDAEVAALMAELGGRPPTAVATLFWDTNPT